MKKLSILLVVVLALWLLKLSYDVYLLQGQQQQAQQHQSQLEQRNASLNDQMAALKRQIGEPLTTNVAPSAQVDPIPVEQMAPSKLIAMQLDYIEFALQQQQYTLALDKLMKLDQNLESYTLAPALKVSLHQVIEKDRGNIVQFVHARNAQNQKTVNLLQQLDAELAKEIQKQHIGLPEQQDQSFLKRWIQIESVDRPSAVLMQRSLVLKEAQLRLLNAQQLLQKGQYQAFQIELTSIEKSLKQLPDINTQHFIQRIHQLKQSPVFTAPVLNTRTLIG
ncbi:hypothetical protein D7V64_13925 [Acinetobacter cumulans]|uniref:Uncharacterized protein n=1 Tax=Acinetobacter cumulans TaxID=2136182 RepID=A0A3A8FTY1_9GAMM|nr:MULTISPECIES: hypothetical protein [Acinetobacter]NWK73392.1 hypothetical protein [Acinetobacter sp. SwsAc6]QCO20988.1 hypothetical protein C9E88_005420 [Acinetobacter cumulans]RKG49296.1 hypothetical protein D7V64_13925 [Acinetobacter cumulans]RLL34176.1 hypothetical protein D9K80_11395 [Acinetobacter cumulans]